MQASKLNEFLKGFLQGKHFQSSIKNEVETYVLMMDQRGSSIPLVFEEDEETSLDTVAFQNLLLKTISGDLTNIDLAYICDCLTLGDKVNFESEEIENAVFEIADPEINGGYKSIGELQRMIERFRKNS